jgi:uncharacterized spore protein YtfJ
MLQGINVFAESISKSEEVIEMTGRLYEAARSEAAFSKPFTQGEYAVITAAEVSISLGVGFGGGGGSGQEEAEDKDSSQGFGGGGGGGGVASSRPVAAIEIGPGGVVVEPIVDVTKIALAFFTAVGAMAVMASKMRSE